MSFTAVDPSDAFIPSLSVTNGAREPWNDGVAFGHHVLHPSTTRPARTDLPSFWTPSRPSPTAEVRLLFKLPHGSPPPTVCWDAADRAQLATYHRASDGPTELPDRHRHQRPHTRQPAPPASPTSTDNVVPFAVQSLHPLTIFLGVVCCIVLVTPVFVPKNPHRIPRTTIDVYRYLLPINPLLDLPLDLLDLLVYPQTNDPLICPTTTTHCSAVT